MLRVSKNHPCPICEHTDWCLYSADGQVALCTRNLNGIKTKTGKDGTKMGLHILGREIVPAAPQRIPTIPPPSPLASLPLRNKIYQALIALSPAAIYEELRMDLMNRGFNLADTYRFGGLPATVAERKKIILTLQSFLGDTNYDHVPGFWRSKSGNLHFWQPYDPGTPWLLIPFYSADGLIQGLQYRRPTEKARYGWINSKKYPLGASTGKLTHYVQPVRESAKIAVIEGALKAEIYARHFPTHQTIAIDGVNTGHDAVLRAAAGKTLYIGFDQDWKSNQHVRHHLESLIKRRGNQPTFLYEWDNSIKGIDEALNAQIPLQLINGQVVQITGQLVRYFS